jgi:hypothetical protein
MIPQIVTGLFVVGATLNVVGNAAAAGAGYGMGRKFGRKLCEGLDQVESSMMNTVQKFRQ